MDMIPEWHARGYEMTINLRSLLPNPILSHDIIKYLSISRHMNISPYIIRYHACEAHIHETCAARFHVPHHHAARSGGRIPEPLGASGSDILTFFAAWWPLSAGTLTVAGRQGRRAAAGSEAAREEARAAARAACFAAAGSKAARAAARAACAASESASTC